MIPHEPNTPRIHNAEGERVDEPVQCQACLQAWPCEVEVLRRENTALLREVHAMHARTWLDTLSYAETALEGSSDNGDRYAAQQIREHLDALKVWP